MKKENIRIRKLIKKEKPIQCHCFKNGHPKKWCKLPIIHKGKCDWETKPKNTKKNKR